MIELELLNGGMLHLPLSEISAIERGNFSEEEDGMVKEFILHLRSGKSFTIANEKWQVEALIGDCTLLYLLEKLKTIYGETQINPR